MQRKSEYQFINVKPDKKSREYQKVILEHAREGWRLVQVFAPGAGGLWGKENFCEVIMEREIQE